MNVTNSHFVADFATQQTKNLPIYIFVNWGIIHNLYFFPNWMPDYCLPLFQYILLCIRHIDFLMSSFFICIVFIFLFSPTKVLLCYNPVKCILIPIVRTSNIILPSEMFQRFYVSLFFLTFQLFLKSFFLHSSYLEVLAPHQSQIPSKPDIIL